MNDQSSSAARLSRTPLHSLHVELGAKMVPFAGYEMPVQYPLGILKEHTHTRAAAGLFDVSHMGQIALRGPNAARALERLVPVDIIDLPAERQRYALLTNEGGGVLDDLMITNTGEDLFLVVNAACKAQDAKHLEAHLAGECELEVLGSRGLLALQGPSAAEALAPLAPRARELVFMQARAMPVDGVDCFVSRSGYTGEDGFEISVPAQAAEAIARALLERPGVEPIGLGARDSLRLEAGLCLYGHELGPEITPVEAGLIWALSKVRRPGGARAGGYLGAGAILSQLEAGPARRRVGLSPEGKAPVREGAPLVDSNGEPVGEVTSGGYGPSAGGPIAMGYVDAAHAAPGTRIEALVRDRPRPAQVVKLPFVPHRYHRG